MYAEYRWFFFQLLGYPVSHPKLLRVNGQDMAIENGTAAGKRQRQAAAHHLG